MKHPSLTRAGLAAVILLLFVGSSLAGAPLKGIDVKLGKNPGGMAAARTTDRSGGFDFGVVPKGNYRLTVVLPALVKGAAEVIVKGGTEGTADVKLLPPSNALKNSAHANEVLVTSDGTHAITGIVETAG